MTAIEIITHYFKGRNLLIYKSNLPALMERKDVVRGEYVRHTIQHEQEIMYILNGEICKKTISHTSQAKGLEGLDHESNLYISVLKNIESWDGIGTPPLNTKITERAYKYKNSISSHEKNFYKEYVLEKENILDVEVNYNETGYYTIKIVFITDDGYENEVNFYIVQGE